MTKKKNSNRSASNKKSKSNIKRSAKSVSPTIQIDILDRREVAKKIREQINNEGESNINESEAKRRANKINLICTYLEHLSVPDDDILNMFSLFLVQEENILYNFGYFADKISTFKESISPIQERLDHIIKCCNSISILSSSMYIFRFDELYDFYFENGSYNVKIEIQNAHNFSLNYKRKYILRVLDKKTNDTVSIQELDSLDNVKVIEKEKTIKIYTTNND